MQTRPKLLYPSMVIAAITVTVFSLLGIATLVGAIPFAHSEGGSSPSFFSDSGQPSNPAPASATSESTPPDRSPLVAGHCQSCGTVISVNRVEQKGQGTGIGAVAGGVAGALLGNGMGQGNGRTAMTLLGGAGGAYAGNEIEKNTHKTSFYRIRVRMEDGRVRSINQRDLPSVVAGDHVKIVDGVIVQQS